MSHLNVRMLPNQYPPRVEAWFPLYRRSLGYLYYAKIVQIYNVHLNGDGSAIYRIDAVCQAMSENDQAMCVVPVYDYEAQQWGELDELVPPPPQAQTKEVA